MSEDHGRNTARAACEDIAEMVAALECDYERLHELQEARADLVSDANPWADNPQDAPASWSCGCGIDCIPDRSQAGCVHIIDCPWNAVSVWDETYEEELAELEQAAGDCESTDQARQRIDEDPLSVQVRSGWVTPGEDFEAEEFAILLTTGGPAVRIRGELGPGNEPSRAWVEYQDWFTPWIELVDRPIETDTLLTYCRQFYYGE